MPHSLFLGVHVSRIIFVRSNLDRHVLRNLKSVTFKPDAFHRIIGHQTHLPYAERMEDVGAYSVIPFVCLVSEMQVGVNSIESVFLKLAVA